MTKKPIATNIAKNGFDSQPHSTMLADGKRLHLNHGPIDLIIEAFGPKQDIIHAYLQATARFETILQELVKELPLLRSPLTPNSPSPVGIIARAMRNAITPHAARFITPMAAVAGGVADEILGCLMSGLDLERAYVNNGGDIALYLNPALKQVFHVGVVADPRSGKLVTKALINGKSRIRGVATSGRHGRSHSLGIADSVTVFAASAAAADAAATIIANDVNVPDCPQITRTPAIELAPDSDLGEQLVTTQVEPLARDQISMALDNGETTARYLCDNGTIEAAFLSLQGEERLIGWAIDPPHRNTLPPSLTHPTNRITHARSYRS